MNHRIHKALGVVTALGLIAATAVTASATSVAGFAGQPQNPGQYSCFTNAWGAVINQCAGVEEYCVALESDQSSHDVRVTVTAPSGNYNGISCIAQSATNTSQFYAGSGTPRFPAVTGTPYQIDLGSVTVPSQGGLWACCYMEQGSQLNSIQY